MPPGCRFLEFSQQAFNQSIGNGAFPPTSAVIVRNWITTRRRDAAKEEATNTCNRQSEYPTLSRRI